MGVATVSAPGVLPPILTAALPETRPGAPPELRLQLGSTALVKGGRYWLRRFFKHLVWAARRWAGWTVGAALFSLVALLAALLDRALIKTWREEGVRALGVALVLALAVYVRLLLDRNAPLPGKALLLFAILYGVAPRDLLPDTVLPVGFVDDFIAVTLASRCFMHLCPSRLVERHAVRAERAWNRARSRNRPF